MNVAIIPARGGSKRIPRKNVRPFCGKPMIGWAIGAAIDCGMFERIIVSTEDPEVAEVALGFGAEVPFIRPRELSGDHVATVPVIRHAIGWLAREGGEPGHVCCIYATAPFLRPGPLKDGHSLLESDGSVDFVFSAARFHFPIQRAVRLDETGRVSMFCPEHESARSQDLEPAFHDAGQFYWGRTRAWMEEDRIFSARSRIVELPPERVQDIDTAEDWQMAEVKFRALLEGGS